MAKKKYQRGGPVDLEALGITPVGKRTEEERAQLDRGTDLTAVLGEAGVDPVGTVQREGAEFIRTGELGGYDLEAARRAAQVTSPFPDEPGTSRASRELPEAFMGSGVLHGLDIPPADVAKIAAAAVTTFDPMELAQMLYRADPENIAITTAPDGAIIATNRKTGAKGVINEPGLSPMDMVQLLGVGAAFAPAGKIATMAPSLTQRLLAGTAAAGATEAGIQELQERAGGRFDPIDVGVSGALGPIGELGRPLIGFGQRVGRFIGSYFPEDFFAKNFPRLAEAKFGTGPGGLFGILPEAKRQALNFAEAGRGYLQSGRRAVITTQDAVYETMKPWKQMLLKVVERMPLTGTGGLRAAQREERIEILRHLGERFNLNPHTNYGMTVLNDIAERSGAQLDAANAAIKAATEAIGDNPVVIRDFTRTITPMINDEKRYGELADQGLIGILEKLRNGVWQGGVPGPRGKLSRNFGQINDLLDRVYAEAANAGPAAREAVEKAAEALRRDLIRTAEEHGGEAGLEYAAASRSIQDLVRNASSRSLDALIERGEIDQQVIRRVLKSNNSAQLNTLYEAMTPEGRNAARQMIMRDALKVAGWRRGPVNEAPINAQRFHDWLNKPAVDQQLRAFFPSKTDQQMLGGMMEYLSMTADAQTTGKGVGMAAAMMTGIGTGVNAITAGIAGGIGHAYQSGPVRDLFLRLYHVKGDQRMKDALMQRITPFLMGIGRQVAQDWTENDPHDQVYMQDLYDSEGNPLDTPTGGGAMEDLRRAVGAAEGTGQDVSTRLEEMLVQ